MSTGATPSAARSASAKPRRRLRWPTPSSRPSGYGCYSRSRNESGPQGGCSLGSLIKRERPAGRSGDFLPPPQPSDETAEGQHETGQASADNGTWDRGAGTLKLSILEIPPSAKTENPA